MGLFRWLAKLIFGPPVIRPRPDSPESPRPTGLPRPGVAAPPRVPPRTITLDNLDASQFAPLPQAELRRQAASLGWQWGNPWFGRTDRIPPPDDPRTKLIDQGMVGHGLITGDELVEIHQVGLQMDEVRPHEAAIQQAGERAVQLSREERAERRKQKKAQAAERKRRHAEDVVRRRQTDIVFLGRGVSRGLSDRRANVEKLQQFGLPVLATPADVATALGATIPQLRWLAFHSDASPVTHYTRFEVPKKSGGVRQLAAPRRYIAAAQEWILANILTRVPNHVAAHGFVAGRSTVSNASPHVGRAVVLNTDLTDFFPTITFPRVKGVFEGLGYSPAAASILALLCTDSPRRPVEYEGVRAYAAVGPRSLPQGACTSPALSNLVARNLDARLAGISTKLGWTFTRYADDLTFSADIEAGKNVGYLMARIRHIASDEGFAVKEEKTRVLKRNTAQTVTGIVVNERPSVPRELRRRLRAILHRAKFEGLERQNRENHPHFEGWVRGMLAYMHMVNPEQARKLWRELPGNL